VRIYFLLLLTLLAADQLTKHWIVANFSLYEVREIIPGLFNLVHVTNKGAAFSMFASVDSPWRHWFFVSVNGAATVGLTVAAWRLYRQQPLYRISFAMIASGALGNLIDRLRYGAVTDFLDFYLGSYHWPAFNVADSSICVGVGLLFIVNLLDFKKETAEKKA